MPVTHNLVSTHIVVFKMSIFEVCLVFVTHVIKKVTKVLGMYVYKLWGAYWATRHTHNKITK